MRHPATHGIDFEQTVERDEQKAIRVEPVVSRCQSAFPIYAMTIYIGMPGDEPIKARPQGQMSDVGLQEVNMGLLLAGPPQRNRIEVERNNQGVRRIKREMIASTAAEFQDRARTGQLS